MYNTTNKYSGYFISSACNISPRLELADLVSNFTLVNRVAFPKKISASSKAIGVAEMPQMNLAIPG